MEVEPSPLMPTTTTATATATASSMEYGADSTSSSQSLLPSSSSSSSWFRKTVSSKFKFPTRNKSSSFTSPLVFLTDNSNSTSTTSDTTQEESLSSNNGSEEDTTTRNIDIPPQDNTLHHPLRHVSLAKSSRTPSWMSCVIPLSCLLTHVIFLYGQLAPMWQLTLVGDIDVWANATSKTTKTTFDALGVPHQMHFTVNQERNVETFTYMYAIRQLWYAKGLETNIWGPRLAALLLVFFSGIWPHLKSILLHMTWVKNQIDPRLRTRTLQWLGVLGKWSLADVLTVCVMVGVLNLEWIVNPSQIKQGFMDQLPLVVSVLKDTYHSSQVCTYLLGYKTDCNVDHNVGHMAKCRACKSVVGTAYHHPDWAKSTGKTLFNGISTSGGGSAELVVRGLKGIYAFCGAVILSVLLSFIVDVLDHRVRTAAQSQHPNDNNTDDNDNEPEDESALEEEHTLQFTIQQESQDQVANTSIDLFEDPESEIQALTIPATQGGGEEQSTPVIQPMEVDEMTTQSLLSHSPQLQEDTTRPSFISRMGQLICMCIPKNITLGLLLSSASKVMIVLAVTVPTMERKVKGAIPLVLHDILGVTWKKTYSLTTLMETTGKAGGWDILLMSTFSLFCVFGPLCRAILCILRRVLLSSRSRSRRARNTNTSPIIPHEQHGQYIKTVSTMIKFMGAFCAWEVFVVAMFMVQMLMPSITSTILKKPQCSLIPGNEENNGSCLEVEFNILDFNFWCFIVGGGILLWYESSSLSSKRSSSSRLLLPHRPFHQATRTRMAYNNVNIQHNDDEDHPYVQLEGTNEDDIIETNNIQMDPLSL